MWARPRPPSAGIPPTGSESAGSDREASAYSRGGAAADRKPSTRRGAADPVKALMHRHRELCERAVDPLEIAAGLEAHGVTDRTATRFRHRDVFSLAEELYARVPRAGDTGPAARGAGHPQACAPAGPLLTLLPGALCAATVTGLRLTEGRPRLAVAVVGALAVSMGLRAAVRRGPLRAARAWHLTTSTRAWTCGLLAYALLGDGLLAAGIEGGPAGRPPEAPTAPGRQPRVRRRPRPRRRPGGLVRSPLRRTRPAPARHQPGPGGVRLRRAAPAPRACSRCSCARSADCSPAAGAWLGEPRRVRRGRCPRRAAAARPAAHRARLHPRSRRRPRRRRRGRGAGTGCSVSPAASPAASLLARPVETVADAWGPGSVPALACGAAALVLLVHATGPCPGPRPTRHTDDTP